MAEQQGKSRKPKGENGSPNVVKEAAKVSGKKAKTPPHQTSQPGIENPESVVILSSAEERNPESSKDIFIKGARMHNLKNVDVSFPRNKLIVVTGVSGSGKSSLTMDTLFAEGQRRYAESLSAYARQFLSRMDKPDVDYIRNICPAIAILQKVTARTPRSTVGSMTEIYDYLRLLFARAGRTISPVSGKEVKKDSVSDVVDFIQKLPPEAKVLIMVKLVPHYGRSVAEELQILMQKGFARIYTEKEGTLRIEDVLDLPPATMVEEPEFKRTVKKPSKKQTLEAPEESGVDEMVIAQQKAKKPGANAVIPKGDIYLLIDRIVTKEFDEDDIHRLSDSVQTAFYESEGDCLLQVTHASTPVADKHNPAADKGNATYTVAPDKPTPVTDKHTPVTDKHTPVTDKYTPVTDNLTPGTDNLSAGIYSFNSRFEADGMRFEEPTPNLFSFNNPFGACPECEGFGQVLGIDADLVIPDKRLSVYEGAVMAWKGEKMSEWQSKFIRDAARFEFPIHKAIMDLSKKEYDLLWNGNSKVSGIKDFFGMVSQNLYKIQYRIMQARFRGKTECPTCNGARLRPEALYVKVNGATIADLMTLPAGDLAEWFKAIRLTESEATIAKRILIEVNSRLQTLLDVGLTYLTLSRTANTLSGGESQRIQLTKFLGSNLTDSLYILDEPSIGLHPRDTARLIEVLKNLRDLGNTVVVVEHDEMIMREADYIIDMGPLAAHLGGEVVAVGNADELMENEASLTGKYLSGKLSIEAPETLRKSVAHIRIEGARQNNLKDITVSFPLNTLCVVTGVSGSGKTTLVKQTLYPALMKHYGLGTDRPGLHKALSGGLKDIASVEMIDQNPIGKSSRSNPVTYIKAYDEIRNVMAKQPAAKMRGFEARHFSFNTDGGRCDTCKGEGEVVVEMQFLADVHLVCESCRGRRFKEEVLEVTYRGKSIYDILELGVDEAIEFFKDEKKIAKAIQPLSDVGLGYVKLGQSSDTLSGGEAQRVKLASFLGRGAMRDKVLFIFDEPTTGLHFHDIKKLLASFNALIGQGHSIIVIEHNTDVIKSADWLIDLGPEGGEGGGYLLYEGKPKDIKSVKESLTAKFM